MNAFIAGSFETITKSISTSTKLPSRLRLQTRGHPCLYSAKYVYRTFNFASFNFLHSFFGYLLKNLILIIVFFAMDIVRSRTEYKEYKEVLPCFAVQFFTSSGYDCF
jgi:hypothetical protein